MIPLAGSKLGTKIEVTVPKDWTARQWLKCIAVCEQQGHQFNPVEWWKPLGSDGYIMNREPMNGMFIGIEPDGYAHT